MKINKIVLYNFNSYEGLNEFDFTCENNSKNIILIGGKNGAGKTSLFTAIKIALYGPLSFGYVGVNPKYIAKIKDCINSRAFQKDVVRSKVQISVSLTVEREIKEYEITREWDYTKQKLDEKYYVKTEDRFLDGQELSYFQNYLQSMIPPDLFEFFLFDGEEVGSIFSTSTYNSYVKNAVYTLCGLDVFEIIRKYTTGYAGKASSKDEEKIYSHYKELRKNADEIDISFADLEAQIASDKNELEKVETELIEIETAFKNAGGITEVERQALMKEFTEAEHTKTESLTKIKMFVEGLMPFIILRDFTGRITEQLDFEEKGEIYYYVQQKLKRQEIKKALNEKQEVSEDTVEALMDFFYKNNIKRQILDHILNCHPSFFEQLVVNLLLEMGYGSDELSGRVIGKSHDGGIDGVIYEDKLGLSKIYIQAKRNNSSNTIGRPLLQAFVGAMQDVQKGVFITTSTFTKGARNYAEKQQQKSLKLIDGDLLAELMIKYGIGLEKIQTYTVYKINEDFFE